MLALTCRRQLWTLFMAASHLLMSSVFKYFGRFGSFGLAECTQNIQHFYIKCPPTDSTYRACCLLSLSVHAHFNHGQLHTAKMNRVTPPVRFLCSQQFISSSRVIRHPNYDSWNIHNDIMAIKLSRPATLNNNVQPVALIDLSLHPMSLNQKTPLQKKKNTDTLTSLIFLPLSHTL